MTRVGGKIVRGLGVASGCVLRQIGHLLEYEPRLIDCYPGTINVELESPLKVASWDWTSRPIAWAEYQPDFTEQFSGLEIEFVYLKASNLAWLYCPHRSPHRNDP